MTISLVTGAGGFVGGHLCRHLAARGHELRRVSSKPGVCSWRGLDLLERDEDRMAEALEGIRHVYFLAGIAHEAVAGGSTGLLRQVNVEAPVRWLRAADRAGVSRFVWLSSIKVLGDRSTVPLTPEHFRQPGDAYAESKADAERRLLETSLAATSLAVVRPPLVYGPGVRGNFAALLRLADSPLPLPLGRATAPRSLVAVDNLCDLLVRLGDDGEGIFHVADDGDVTVAALLERLRRSLGRPRRLVGVPRTFVRMAAASCGRRGMYLRLFEPLQVDSSATRRRLAWSPPRSLDDALTETVTWWQTSR